MLTSPMYAIQYSKPARKTLKAMPSASATLIMAKIEKLAQDPYAPNNNVKKLTGHAGFRLRVGDWRVVYVVHEDVLLIAVVRIAPRGGVYR